MGGVNFPFLKSAKMLATVALATLALQTSAQNQMRTWTLPPYRVNFAPAGTPTLPLASAGQYRVANGAYGVNGNLLFYVKDLNVYKADGTSMGALTGYLANGTTTHFNSPTKEMPIVPVPNSCSKYYVIWLGNTGGFGSSNHLRVATIDVAANTVTNQAQNVSLGVFGNEYAGLAVGKTLASGNRMLYVVTGSAITPFTISSSGLSQGTATPNPFGGYVSSAELNHTGTKLAWGNFNFPYMYELNITSTTGFPTGGSTLFPTASNGSVRDVEYDAAGNLYANVVTGITATDGIYKRALGGTSALPFVLNTAYANSQIELGYDGLLYLINSSGKMVSINPSNASEAFPNASITIQSNQNSINNFAYSLPDQIDGENYTLFRGTPTLEAPSMNLTSIERGSIRPTDNVYETSNCNTVLEASLVGTYSAYNLTIYTSDINSTQGTQIYTSGVINGTYPATDLTTLPNQNNSQPNWLRNNLGYFLVKLEVSNGGCESAIVQSFLINNIKFFTYTDLGVSNTAAVTATNGSFKVFNCVPITLKPVRTKNSQYKLSLQSATSTGQVTSGTGSWAYIPSTFTTGVYPYSTDLRTLPGTNNYIQNMTTGYILATLELKDDCNPSITKTALLNVGTLSAATADFLFNVGDGFTTVDPDVTTLANPAEVGLYALGVNPQQSTGSINSYTMKIEKMSQSNGTVLATVCNNPTPTVVPGYINFTNRPLNGYVSSNCAQSPGYFSLPANLNQVYRLYFTVTNTCGSTSKSGYFRNSNVNARQGDVEETANIQETVMTQGHAAYPNPSTGKATIAYMLDNETNVSLSITDAQGNKMASILNNVPQGIGQYVQTVDLSSLPDGIYYYRLNTDNAVVGKIVKSSKKFPIIIT